VNCDVTYEELAALAAGELDADRAAEVQAHLPACQRCRRRMDALRGADAVLGGLRHEQPSPQTLLAVRHELAAALRPPQPAEVMTLEEVATFLRLTDEQLDEVLEDLPAFELAGQVRVRHARLVEWLEQRERNYARQTAASWAARAIVPERPR